jgi:serine phosphatase RsbU (regulator of sigma subunit)
VEYGPVIATPDEEPGLTDAENPAGEMFGDERLLEIIRQVAPSGSAALRGEALERL